jgi:hypothetical protein
MEFVDRFWQDAASVFETASAAADGTPLQMAILIDNRNGMRIVDSTGWTADALRREYSADTAYTVIRSGNTIAVEGYNGHETCSLKKKAPANAFHALLGGIAPHLVRPNTLALAS